MGGRNVEDRQTLLRELTTTCGLILVHGEEWRPEETSRVLWNNRIAWLTEGWSDAEAKDVLEEAERLAAAEYVKQHPER